jgi:hypothetical protein
LARALRGAGLRVVAAPSIAHVQRWPAGDIVVTEAERFTPMWKTLGATHVVVLADTEEDGLECCASGATLWLPRGCQPHLLVDAVEAVMSGGEIHGSDAADSPAIPPARGIELIVRRGAQRRYDLLRRKTVGLPVVVRWDRRTSDRRADVMSGAGTTPGDDRRRLDRRQTPPYTWDVADFAVVEKPIER